MDESLDECVSGVLKHFGMARCNRLKSLPQQMAQRTEFTDIYLASCTGIDSPPDVSRLPHLEYAFSRGSSDTVKAWKQGGCAADPPSQTSQAAVQYHRPHAARARARKAYCLLHAVPRSIIRLYD